MKRNRKIFLTTFEEALDVMARKNVVFSRASYGMPRAAEGCRPPFGTIDYTLLPEAFKQLQQLPGVISTMIMPEGIRIHRGWFLPSNSAAQGIVVERYGDQFRWANRPDRPLITDAGDIADFLKYWDEEFAVTH